MSRTPAEKLAALRANIVADRADGRLPPETLDTPRGPNYPCALVRSITAPDMAACDLAQAMTEGTAPADVLRFAGATGVYSGMSHYKMRRVLARDRRLSAIHEAGHYVMAQYVGIRSCGAWIYPTRPADPLYEKTTCGHFTALRREFDRLSFRRLMMVGFAGAIARYAWLVRPGISEGADNPLFDWDSVEDDVSPSDWNLIDLSPEYMPRAAGIAIEKAWDLLRPDGGQLWHPLCKTARTLMQQGFVEMKPGLVATAQRQKLQREQNIGEPLY